ncbi:MAG: DegV family protein, partial [Dehalococcoidia bacterium]
MTVKIVTDSTADLLPQLAHEMGTSVVPLSVIFGDEVFQEGVEISHDLFYEKLAHSREIPTTSAPSVGDFLSVYEPLLGETNEIVSIHLSGKLSATYNNACQATAHLADRGARIEVIDSRLASFATGFVVLAAARAAQGGAGLEQVRAIAERSIDRVHLLIAVDTLEYLRRGGRIGRARAFLGTVLRVTPLLTLQDGEVQPEGRVRTTARALERLYQFCTSYPRVREMAVAYSTNPLEAEELRSRLAAARPGVTVHATRVGPVLGSHVGPGVLGAGV